MRLLALLAFLGMSVSFAASYEETIAWEAAAEKYLNQGDLEIYDLELGSTITFKYDKEFLTPVYEVATFECTGVPYLTTTFPEFAELSCVEIEPPLYDEL